MLGNWSLGAYFKEYSVKCSFEFLTSSDYLNIPKDSLYVSVFEGDQEIPRDTETAKVWESLGISKDRIHYLSKDHNFGGLLDLKGLVGQILKYMWILESLSVLLTVILRVLVVSILKFGIMFLCNTIKMKMVIT